MEFSPPLDPIVLWDGVTVSYKSATEQRASSYTCKGEGLLRYGHAYEPDIRAYIPPANAHLTKAGKPRVNKLHIKHFPLEWWKAQCAFRGLGIGGKIGELQARLRDVKAGDKPMIKDLRDLEEKANMEFRVKNAAARDAEAAREKAEADKAEAETIQFLETNFPTGTSGADEDKIMMIEANTRFELSNCARKLGLAYGYFAPRYMVSPYQCWEIVGRRASSVEKKKLELRGKDNENIEECDKKRKREEEAKREAEEQVYINKRQRVMDHAVKNKSKDWDVAGTWKIRCPEIEKQFGCPPGSILPLDRPSMNDLSMEIFWKETSKGTQLFAKFDLGILTGYMRFERQRSTGQESKGVPVQKQSKISAHHSNDNYNDIVSESYDLDRRSPTPESFYLSSSAARPSDRCPTWNYRWRGNDECRNYIQWDSDEKAYEITFEEPMGTKLRGTFCCSFLDECEFTGIKLGLGGDSSFDISEEWADRSSRAPSSGWGRW
jgi:hypothetical protein